MRDRLPWMLAAAVALAAGVWAGLARLGWVIPPLAPHHPTVHGPLMLGGFLGVLIGFEWARSLGRWWAYLTPVLAATSTVWILLRSEWRPAAWMLTAAGLVACAIFVQRLFRRDDLAIRTQALGALAWFLGNLQWALTGRVLIAVPWWGAFLVLTILGSRWKLGREPDSSRGQTQFVLSLAVVFGSLLVAYIDHDLGLRGYGVGLIGLAAWGLRWDPALTTSTPNRFATLNVVGCYFWLLVSGALMLIWGRRLGGLAWDGALHALFLGFVFSMIFAYTPAFLGIILSRAPGRLPVFYSHVVLLHLSLAVRIGCDLLGSAEGRAFGSLLNMVAIVAFLLNTLRAMIMGSTLEA